MWVGTENGQSLGAGIDEEPTKEAETERLVQIVARAFEGEESEQPPLSQGQVRAEDWPLVTAWTLLLAVLG